MSKDSLKTQLDNLSKKQLKHLIYKIVERKFGHQEELLGLPDTMVKESQVNYDLIRELLLHWLLEDVENEKDVQYWLEKMDKDDTQVTFAGQGVKGHENLAILYVFGGLISSDSAQQILKISHSTDHELLDKIAQKLTKQKQILYPRSRVDVLMFTAINEEFEAVKQKATYVSVEDNFINRTSYVRLKYNELDVALCKTGQGNPRAAAEVASALAFYEPTLCVFAGIAGRVKEKVNKFDIIIPSQVNYIESGKDSEKGSLHRPFGGEIKNKMQNKLERFKNEVLIHDPNKYTLHEQPIASGEEVAVTLNGEVMKRITLHMENVVAYEMEGYGFYTAINNTNIKYLLIRCISDFIDKKDEHYLSGDREKAAETAVAFAFDFISFLQKDNFFTSNQ